MKQTHCNNPSCGKELIHTEGRRPKKYCSVGCRNAHYKVLYTSKKKENGVPLPKDFIEAKNIGILKEDGTIEKIFKWNGREMIMQPDEQIKRLLTEEYGQMGNTGEIKRDTWEHTDIKITKPQESTQPATDKKPFMSDAIKKKLGL